MTLVSARSVLEPYVFGDTSASENQNFYDYAFSEPRKTFANTYDALISTSLAATPHIKVPSKASVPAFSHDEDIIRSNSRTFAKNGKRTDGIYFRKPFASLSAAPTQLPPPSPLTPETCIAIVGVGYVGTTLLEEFSKAFPHSIGYDVSASRIAHLSGTVFPSSCPKYKNLQFTTDERELRRASYFLIAVPTLLRGDAQNGNAINIGTSMIAKPHQLTNLDYVVAAVSTVLRNCGPGSVLILESSVSVGTTRALLGSHSYRIYGGMSPERADPGRVSPVAATVPKVVSGLTPAATAAITALYSRCYDHVIPVSSPEVAEMTKLHENCFRMVNIAYANEIADACRSMNIDYREVADAASTKPYGFMRFDAGLGVGGHCIPVNPYYLFDSCKKGALPMLERATNTMKQRPRKLGRAFHRRVMLEMAKRRGVAVASLQAVQLPRVLVVGLAFKPGEAVVSYSPGVSFAGTLQDAGCSRLAYYDPLVEHDALQGDRGWLEKLMDGSWAHRRLEAEFDGIAVCMRQRGIDWAVLDRVERRHCCFVRSYT